MRKHIQLHLSKIKRTVMSLVLSMCGLLPPLRGDGKPKLAKVYVWSRAYLTLAHVRLRSCRSLVGNAGGKNTAQVVDGPYPT
jgi:hypothetical protein